jgi:hypothetical protein
MLRIAATEQLSKSFPERQDLRAFFDAGYVPSPVFIFHLFSNSALKAAKQAFCLEAVA